MTLASMLGFFLVGIVGMFLFIGFIGALASIGSSTPSMTTSSVLKIDMGSVAIVEQEEPLDPMAVLQGNVSQSITLWDAVQAVNAAAEDPNIKMIYLDATSCISGLASLEEFRKALGNFRASGKPILSFIENPSSGAYYIASVADKVYMSSYCGSAQSVMNGVGTEMYFLKDILDKFGVNIQLIRHGKYKSAGEMYIKNAPSKENLEQTEAMVTSLWKTIVGGISESRGISQDKFCELVDDLKLCTPQDFLDNGLIDAVMDNVELLEQLSIVSQDESFRKGKGKMVSLSDYSSANVLPNLKARNKIAVIYANGQIFDGNDTEGVAGDRFMKVIAKVEADSTIKAVVLRVASPGGSVLASDKIKQQLDRLRKVKPVVASYGSYAASGGYWISNACDRIFTDGTTLTGSIGVFATVPDFGKLYKDVLHVGVATVGSSKHTDMYSLTRPLDAEEMAYMQASVEDIYGTFVNTVAQGRSLDPEFVDSIAQGRVWTGAEALGLGLVDEIGTLEDAVHYAAGLVSGGDSSLDSWNVKAYPAPVSEFEAILKMFGGSSSDEALSSLPFYSVYKAYKETIADGQTKLYARLPYEYVIRF